MITDYTPVEKQRQVLVYGTLRPGMGNYAVMLQGHTSAEETVRVDGYRMYGTAREGFPYVMKRESSSIVATLITLKPGHYDHVMLNLDYLEGFTSPGHKDNHYERKLIDMRREDGEVIQVWMYIIEGKDAEEVASTYSPTPNGDWVEEIRNAYTERGLEALLNN